MKEGGRGREEGGGREGGRREGRRGINILIFIPRPWWVPERGETKTHQQEAVASPHHPTFHHPTSSLATWARCPHHARGRKKNVWSL